MWERGCPQHSEVSDGREIMLSPVYTGPNIVALFVATEYHVNIHRLKNGVLGVVLVGM